MCWRKLIKKYIEKWILFILKKKIQIFKFVSRFVKTLENFEEQLNKVTSKIIKESGCNRCSLRYIFIKQNTSSFLHPSWFIASFFENLITLVFIFHFWEPVLFFTNFSSNNETASREFCKTITTNTYAEITNTTKNVYVYNGEWNNNFVFPVFSNVSTKPNIDEILNIRQNINKR